MFLKGAGEAEKHMDVVARLRRHLGSGAGHHIREADVVDSDLHTVLGAPLLGKRVEPRVVGGHEVAPLQDLELPCRPGVADEDSGAGSSGRSGAGDEFGALHNKSTACFHLDPRWIGSAVTK